MIDRVSVHFYDRKGELLFKQRIDKNSFIPRVGDVYYLTLTEKIGGKYIYYGTVTKVIVEYYAGLKNENIIIKIKKE